MAILVTGGAGFIGSHTCVELLNAGYDNVIIYDNFSNSSKKVIDRINKLTGKKVECYEGSIHSIQNLEELILRKQVNIVIHCAGAKSVEESCRLPLYYYDNNVSGTISLLIAINKCTSVESIIFSSSATVYGISGNVPITEDQPKGVCTNPYGWTKSMYFS